LPFFFAVRSSPKDFDIMSVHSLFVVSLLALVNAQSPAGTSLEPLASKVIPFDNIPYQVSGANAGPRGPQQGYNQCNSTTEGPNSLCQTLIMNDISDFCIWSSPKTNDTIGASEQYEIAWCTKPGHGTRIIHPGAITGAQWLYAKDYVQVVGFIDQTAVGLNALDEGGELDPHGDDEQGNPLGGIVYTNGFGQHAAGFAQQFNSKTPSTASETQVVEWIDFIGSNMFCLKMCNPGSLPEAEAALLCNHIYDEIGCTYNAIANYPAINGSFTVCDSDDMAPPGIFTNAAGQTTTWRQPFTGTFSVPYTTSPLASSNCQTFASTDLFAAAATAFPSSATAASAGATGTAGASGSGTRSGSAANPTATGSGAMASGVAISGPLAIFVGAMFGAIITVFV